MIKNDTFLKHSVIMATDQFCIFMTSFVEATKKGDKVHSPIQWKVRLVLWILVGIERRVITSWPACVSWSTQRAMLITIICKSVFSLMKVHKSTCLQNNTHYHNRYAKFSCYIIEVTFFLYKRSPRYNGFAER